MPTTAKVVVNEIEAVGQQPRRQVGDVSDLVQDIQQTGRFYSAVTLERTPQGNLRVISGSRRLKAAQEAGLALVPAIIYEADEMDAVTRLRMQLGENVTRRDLRPLEAALSYYELKVRMDCMYLSDELKVAMPEADDLAGWQAAYAGLLKQAEGQPLERVRETWAEFEQYSGLSRDQRVDLMQLLKLDGAVRARLLDNDNGLSMRHHLALVEAPSSRQGELLTAVLNTAGEVPPVRAVQATARVLSTPGTIYPTSEVLAVSRRLLATQPNQRVERLKESVLAALTTPAAPPTSSAVHPISTPVATQTSSDIQPTTTPAANPTVAEVKQAADEQPADDEPAMVELPTDEVLPASTEQVVTSPPTLAAREPSNPPVASARPELLTAAEQEAEREQWRGRPNPPREMSVAGREFQRISDAAWERLDRHTEEMLAAGEYDDLTALLRSWGEWVGGTLTRLAYAQQRSVNQRQDEQALATYRQEVV